MPAPELLAPVSGWAMRGLLPNLKIEPATLALRRRVSVFDRRWSNDFPNLKLAQSASSHPPLQLLQSLLELLSQTLLQSQEPQEQRHPDPATPRQIRRPAGVQKRQFPRTVPKRTLRTRGVQPEARRRIQYP